MDRNPVLVWFRHDLRLADNPALAAAARIGAPLICLYVRDETQAEDRRPGGAARWWLHHTLRALDASLHAKGQRLYLRAGDPGAVIPELVRKFAIARVFWNREYDAHAIARDEGLKTALGERNCEAQSFNANLLFEPWDVRNRAGEPYRVFSAFWKAARMLPGPAQPLPAPAPLPPPPGGLDKGDRLQTWGLLPAKPDWAGGLRESWTPGEAGARDRFERFMGGALERYAAERDFPARASTSRISPHLHFGEISPRILWHRVHHWQEAERGPAKAAEKFLSELGWREFSYGLLHHNPGLPHTPLRAEFEVFPWAEEPEALSAWQRGATGYPIVDAGMRELWHTGWMHNRVRMIAGSFLVKHLRLHWRHGAAWFWDTLVDADLANNSASWQWIAGCGADAAPYFRIFNPMLQGKKFDPDGTYVRRWVPEIGGLPAAHIHEPWLARATILEKAGIRLGETYPRPIVEHAAARTLALDAFQTLKKSR